MTASGDLRSGRFAFQPRALDANGDRLGEWDEAGGFSRAASAFFRIGGEAVLQQRLQGVQPVEITIRDGARPREISSGWRAVSERGPTRGQAYNIRSVAPAKTAGFLLILAETDGAGGG